MSAWLARRTSRIIRTIEDANTSSVILTIDCLLFVARLVCITALPTKKAISPGGRYLPGADPVLISLNLASARSNLSIEEPHRIENFAEGCGSFRPVSLSKCKNAIVFADIP